MSLCSILAVGAVVVLTKYGSHQVSINARQTHSYQLYLSRGEFALSKSVTTHKHISAYLTSPFNFYCCYCERHCARQVNELANYVICPMFYYYLTMSLSASGRVFAFPVTNPIYWLNFIELVPNLPFTERTHHQN